MRLPYRESCSPSRRHRRCPPVQPVRSRLRAEQLDRVGKTEELHGVFLHNFAWCFDCHCHLEPLFDAGAYQGWSPSAPVSQSQQCRYRQQLLPARVSEAAVIARIVPVAFRQMAPSVFRTAIRSRCHSTYADPNSRHTSPGFPAIISYRMNPSSPVAVPAASVPPQPFPQPVTYSPNRPGALHRVILGHTASLTAVLGVQSTVKLRQVIRAFVAISTADSYADGSTCAPSIHGLVYALM
jgi:hypothetical protein